MLIIYKKTQKKSILSEDQCEWEPALPYLDHILLASFKVGLLPSIQDMSFIEQHMLQGKITLDGGSMGACLLSTYILLSNKCEVFHK